MVVFYPVFKVVSKLGYNSEFFFIFNNGCFISLKGVRKNGDKYTPQQPEQQVGEKDRPFGLYLGFIIGLKWNGNAHAATDISYLIIVTGVAFDTALVNDMGPDQAKIGGNS